MKRLDHLLQPLGCLLLFSFPKLAAPLLLLADLLGLAERVHGLFQFMVQAVDLRLLGGQFLLTVGCHEVGRSLLLLQLRLLRLLIILQLLLQHLLLLGVGSHELLLSGFILEPELLLLDLDRSLLGIEHFIHLHAEGLDLLLRLGLRILDLLADRGLRLLHLKPRLLLRFPNLSLRSFLLQFRRVLRLGDLLIDSLLFVVLVDVEEHPQTVSVVIRAVDEVDIRPPLASVRAGHLKDSQIRILGEHLQMRLSQSLPRNARHFELIERILRDFLRESRHRHAELFRELTAHIDRMPVTRLPGQNTEAPRYFGKDL